MNIKVERIGARVSMASASAIQADITAALRKVAKAVESDWASHTANYSGGTSPAFEQVSANEFVVGDNDKRVIWNVKGTKPHKIRARAGSFLAFQLGGTPKTRVGAIASSPGSRPGGKFVYAKEVSHPGTTARETDEAIRAKEQPVLEREIGRALEGIIR